MTTPATVIVPTHRDPGTLTYALDSVRSQTHRDLEILVVLDGADASTRDVAEIHAAQDPRVGLLDRPKGPGTGADHRHAAIRDAAGEFILFIDEDDLWLPDHVERLLATAVDREAAVVTSTVASLTPSGRVELCLTDHSAGPLRDAVGSWTNIYDTHVTVRRTAYEALPHGLSTGGPAGGGPSGMFREIAADASIRWINVPAVTALSFHGSPRRQAGLGGGRRRRENRRVAGLVASGDLTSSSITTGGSVVSHLFGSFHFLAPSPHEDVLDHLARISGRRDGTAQWEHLTEHQVRMARLTHRFFEYLMAGRLAEFPVEEFGRSAVREFMRSLSEVVSGPPALGRRQRAVWSRILRTRW